ncbi:DNA-dependent ATPase MGS1 (Maintenance of genome stability protein 1) DNA-directed DNA polymerase ATPase [Scheffersomyces stipitis CBS 6054]|uniref:DNA-dependent ATPase MGS1 (Maintenance of genome stability protein 1) DNA-directed DNA polymerase ATPase n=1 Tax=Scheffersomyces stipitis (strain ATCC 58785 / CBS 6054 / NBRC 10063 / NRRL Y-11545) TaxID=322104 RepID=A3LXJ6_PICST|nr:DNA-dependent ATPase MGS1 (Maintenance of genome stability protein 1) DNA-directed DNA polymerase ATPase [Scheffersomyces stipitis CBS 6054]ABN67470.2 DNA-dependent ATPase MGS1 (Maintenance of genome stability protein 1) DNA-directed DNA polymerase ATPase [Scheffersomyces stipitis CBS 6054]
MDSTCPICGKQLSSHLLERHVNTCLDNQESKEVEEVEQPKDVQDLDEVVIVEDEIGEIRKRRHGSDAFAALGLKMDSSQKRQKLERSQKSKPTLTRILIEEKRLKSESRKTSDELKEQLEKLSSSKSYDESLISTPSDQPKVVPEPQEEPKEAKPPPLQSDILTRAQELNKLKREASIPLAHRLRPKSLDDFFGQEKLLGQDGILRNIINADNIPSFILWGVPGVGKTSLARIIAHTTNCKFVELSGAESNAKRLKEVFLQAENEKHLTGRKTILFLDEIHRFNKAVQDLLLPVIEKGVLTVIGATTENPSFTLNNALLSRMHTFVMEQLTTAALIKILARALYQVNKLRKHLYNLHYISLKRDSFKYIAELSMGDSRVALNLLEFVNAYLSTDKFSTKNGEEQPKKMGVINVSAESLKSILKSRDFHNMYDKQGESHYDTISAFHKSVRGSDADAAMFYLVKMLSGGEDPLFIIRRMIVMASEDIGLRDSSCLPFAIAAKEALEFVGMPEGEIILAHCAMKMARAPKSTKSYRALRTAQSLLREKPEITKLPIPMHLRNAPTKLMKELGYGDSYKYNPGYKNGLVKQTYFPEGMEDVHFLEETHLGVVEDSDTSPEEQARAQAQVVDYENFKKDRIKQLKLEYLNRVKATRQETFNKMMARYKKNEITTVPEVPQYIDTNSNGKKEQGKEKISEQDSSSDTDYKDNFEKSYDEFLDPESQPEYFEGDDTGYHYDPEYPLIRDDYEI